MERPMHNIPKILFLLGVIYSTFSCVEISLEQESLIRLVEPSTPKPGEFINISGQGFGTEGLVAISGRTLNMVSWSESFIQAQLPADITGGERYLVLTLSDGRHSDLYPIFVDRQNSSSMNMLRSDLNTNSADEGDADMEVFDQSLDQDSSRIIDFSSDQDDAAMVSGAEVP